MATKICQHHVDLSPASFPHRQLQMRVRTVCLKARSGLRCDSVANAVTSGAVIPLHGGMRRVISTRRDIQSSGRSRHPQHSGRGVMCTK